MIYMLNPPEKYFRFNFGEFSNDNENAKLLIDICKICPKYAISYYFQGNVD